MVSMYFRCHQFVTTFYVGSQSTCTDCCAVLFHIFVCVCVCVCMCVCVCARALACTCMLMKIKYDYDAYIEHTIRLSFLCILSLPRIIFFFHLIFTLEMRNFVKPLKSTEICAPPSPEKGNTVPFCDY